MIFVVFRKLFHLLFCSYVRRYPFRIYPSQAQLLLKSHHFEISFTTVWQMKNNARLNGFKHVISMENWHNHLCNTCAYFLQMVVQSEILGELMWYPDDPRCKLCPVTQIFFQVLDKYYYKLSSYKMYKTNYKRSFKIKEKAGLITNI